MINRRIIILSLLLLMAINIVSCSASNSKDSGTLMAETHYSSGGYADYENYADNKSADYNYFDSYGEKIYETAAAPSAKQNNEISDTRKIVKTVSMTLESMEFDDAVKDIIKTATDIGGYIESSYISGSSIYSSSNTRYASFTIRIPADNLTPYVNDLNKFNVLSLSENSSDITDAYYDADARLKSLETQEERLLKMLEGATELQYMIQVENHLADIRYQIESYYSTLQRYNNQVALSTVNITLNEVIKYQKVDPAPKSFGEQVGNAVQASWINFVNGMQEFLIDLIYALPDLITFFIFVGIIIFIIVLIVKHHKKKKLKKAESQNINKTPPNIMPPDENSQSQ